MGKHTTHSYCHVGDDKPLLGVNIAEHFQSIVARHPGREAMGSLPQDRRLSYRQLSTAVDDLARGLLGTGFKRGDRIGIWSTNNIEWLIVQLATARIGVVLVNINPAYRAKELEYALQRSDIQGLFVIPSFKSSDYVERLTTILPQLKQELLSKQSNKAFPSLRHVIVYDPLTPDETDRPYPGFEIWADVLATGNAISQAELDDTTALLDMDDAINIQYTSGTTGSPKPVVLTHHNILNNAWFTADAMRFTERDRLAVSVPFYHCFGMVLANLLCLSVGACIVIPCEHFDASAVLNAIDDEQCTAVHGVPTMFIAMLAHASYKHLNLASLRTGIMAGAPCPESLMRQVINDMGCREILIGYGETEASPLTHLTRPDDSFEHRINSVGINLPHQEVKIVNTDNGQTVPRGSVGEICFRGYHIMREYYRDDKATRDAVDENGWLYSGDLGVMDEDGYVQVTGRLKEMIIRGGENIYPREIEDCLIAHPSIAEAYVFGVTDDYFGEQVMAWICLHDKSQLSEQDIRDFLEDKIAHFKIPKYISFVKDFPMTITGKPQKFRMRKIAEQRLKQSADAELV